MAKLSAKYEVIYVVDPAVGEEGIAALVEKFSGIVGNYGTVSSVDEWGKRRLAYPINDLVEGYYVYMTCEVSPDMPAELDRVFKITDGILRSIIVAVTSFSWVASPAIPSCAGPAAASRSHPLRSP